MQMAVRQRKLEKLALHRRLFAGLSHVYGTYSPTTGRARVIKRPVSDRVILAHLKGEQPYGVFLLVQDRTRAVVVDFDDHNIEPVRDFVRRAAHYEVSAYVERSKSKGYHVWMFFGESGVLAAKARLITHHILEEIELPDTEVFPKQDALNTSIQYGNFINAPLFGALVPEGRTVFVDIENSFEPFANQWELLESVRRIPESVLDKIIEINELVRNTSEPRSTAPSQPGRPTSGFGLPPCARRILNEGVTCNQRVVCFRLAVHLKRLGLPYDISVAALKVWASKNRPAAGKRIITQSEIAAQTTSAFNRNYRGYGCEDPAITPYCQPECPLHRNNVTDTYPGESLEKKSDET